MNIRISILSGMALWSIPLDEEEAHKYGVRMPSREEIDAEYKICATHVSLYVEIVYAGEMIRLKSPRILPQEVEHQTPKLLATIASVITQRLKDASLLVVESAIPIVPAIE